MLDIIRVPIGYIIDLCYRLVPNYAVALLIFALIMKLILFPLGIKQHKNTVKQAKLRPKEQAIRNRYAGRTDKATQQKMNEEVMKLYQEENYNPASGCLPMILQLVIVFALYAVVNSPIRYVCHIPTENISNISVKVAQMYKAEELKTEGLSDTVVKQIQSMADQIGEDGKPTDKFKNAFSYDLALVNVIRLNGVENFVGEGMLDEGFTEEDLPNFYLFGSSFDLSGTPSFGNFGWLWIIPVLTFVFTFGSMKLNKKMMYQPISQPTGDAALSMKMMDLMMPLMSTFITFSVPAVIAVYWIYQNIFSTVQQWILKTMFPYPTFTEEEMKAVEREMNKGIKQSNKSAKKAAKRAAHRIDLDDDAPAEEASAAKVEAPKNTPKPSGLIPPAALKDESDKGSDSPEEQDIRK
ncbi:MAG: YidC/Oxa1 family membrane protein insertase [Clostridia bacterium]|nr:YidC/Oxa1 family membrane protein insertase [Clostridia bacterium]